MKQAERKLAIVATIEILICMLIITFTNQAKAQRSQAYDHAKLQREYSYEARYKANQAFTMSQAKQALKQAKNKQKQAQSHNRTYARIEAIRTKTASLKSQQK